MLQISIRYLSENVHKKSISIPMTYPNPNNAIMVPFMHERGAKFPDWESIGSLIKALTIPCILDWLNFLTIHFTDVVKYVSLWYKEGLVTYYQSKYQSDFIQNIQNKEINLWKHIGSKREQLVWDRVTSQFSISHIIMKGQLLLDFDRNNKLGHFE